MRDVFSSFFKDIFIKKSLSRLAQHLFIYSLHTLSHSVYTTERVCGIMVIVLKNGPGDQSSSPGEGHLWFHYVLILLLKSMNPLFSIAQSAGAVEYINCTSAE